MSSAPHADLPSETFPHSWAAEVLLTAPLIAPARQFVYPQNVPGEEDALGRGALFVQVHPVAGGNFLATCALGFRDPTLPSGVWACPASDDLLAVAGGYGYRINTSDPNISEFLSQRPITSLLAAPGHGLLLLAGFHTVLALGSQGVCWQSARLSWEGVALAEVRNGELHGQGWDMFADREVPFVVDLRTGAHGGGGYRR